jgi:hypothetical protein
MMLSLNATGRDALCSFSWWELIFRGVRINSENFVLASCCLCARLSVRTYQCGSHWTDFRKVWYCRLLRKSVEELQICLKSDDSVGHFAWRPQEICTVDSSTKYFVALQQCKRKPLLRFHGNTQWFYIVDVNSNAKGRHCCVYVATNVTQTRRNISFYVHCLRC